MVPAERYEILLMKRYYRFKKHEEDQLTIPALPHALSQIGSSVEVIHVTKIRHSLKQDRIQETEQKLSKDLWKSST